MSWKEVLGGGGSNISTSRGLGITAGGGYSREDDACALNGVEKFDCTEACGGHWGVGGRCWTLFIISNSLSSLASCRAKEHSSRSKIVLIRPSSAVMALSLFWVNW